MALGKNTHQQQMSPEKNTPQQQMSPGKNTPQMSPKKVSSSETSLECVQEKQLDYKQVFVRDLKEDTKTEKPDLKEDRKPNFIKVMNLDIITKVLETLVCGLDKEEVLQHILSLSKAHSCFDKIAKSDSFIQFVHKKVWNQKPKRGGWDSKYLEEMKRWQGWDSSYLEQEKRRGVWDSFYLTHRTHRNFKGGVSLYSKISGDESFCKAIGIWGNHISCGYQNGKIQVYEVVGGGLQRVLSCNPYQHREKFHDLAWGIVGFAFVPTVEISVAPAELIFASMDGCIFSVHMSTGEKSLVHLGNHSQDGTLVDFSGGKNGWVALYIGANISFQIWNKGRTPTYRCENFLELDAHNNLGQRVGLRKLRMSDNTVVVCSRTNIISFDIRRPAEVRERLAEKELAVATFDCNLEVCSVVCKNKCRAETFRVDDLTMIASSRIWYDRSNENSSLLYRVQNAFFCTLVFSKGIFCSAINATTEERCRLKLEPRVKKVSAVNMDDKCCVVAGDGAIHLWYYGVF